MYKSLRLPWSVNPSQAEQMYRSAGLVKTKGTIYVLPPSIRTLRESFNDPPRPKTRMSSGAVALCKHFERGEGILVTVSPKSGHGGGEEEGKIRSHRRHPFWTLPKGSNEEKTELAAQVLEDMLKDSGCIGEDQQGWRNVLLVHKGVAVYEVRNQMGYGMRWTLDVVVNDEREDTDVEHVLADADKAWKITKTTFRGFLEPIEGLDHELPGRDMSH